jgi:tetratricopeptide (TPR) repeat protein
MGKLERQYAIGTEKIDHGWNGRTHWPIDRLQMKPTVELSMIVRDGASVLSRCLQSVAPFVDRMVVGDTGSTDDSAAIARKFGAEVVSIPWEQDFARARNRVLEHRKSDWILVLDADEMLDNSGGARIRRLIESHTVFAYHNPRWNYMRDMNARLGFQTAKPNPVVCEASRSYPAYVPLPTTRLFRSHPGLYYEDCVHETITKRLAALHLATGRADFVVHHFGHAEGAEADRQKKDELYHLLGEKKLESNPNDPQALIEMGLAELEIGRRPASALVHFEHVCELSPESAVAWLYAGICLVRLAKLAEALANLERAANLGLQTGLLLQAVGDAHFHSGQFAQARAAYVQVADLGEASPLSEAKRGACDVNLGSVAEGIRRIERAVEAAPACGELYDILAAASLQVGNLLLATQTLEARLLMGKPTDFHFKLAAALQMEIKARQELRAMQQIAS